MTLFFLGVSACEQPPATSDLGFTDSRATWQEPPPLQFDLQHLKLTLHIDPEIRRLSGTAEIALAGIHPNQPTVSFNAAEMSISQVSQIAPGAVQPLTFLHQHNMLTIELPEPLRRGEIISLSIAYSAEPLQGLYFVGPDSAHPDKQAQVWSQGESEENRYWFPGVDHPGDRFTSEMVVTVPSDYTAISNGALLSRRQSGSGVTYHYLQLVPHVNYLVSLVVGHFTEISDAWNGIPLSYYVPQSQETDARIDFSITPEIMAAVSRLTDSDYPFARYAQTVVTDFMWGGMENSSATTLSKDVILDERARLSSSSQDLIVHELAHQWFGDFITPKSWSELWLSEGFATYFEALYAEEAQGPAAYRSAMQQFRRDYLDEVHSSYKRPVVTHIYNDPEALFDAHLYEKGAWILHMLRRQIGETAWADGLAAYVAQHGNDLVETNDLKQAMEAASGTPLTRFFRQWVYSAGHPQLSARWKWSHRDTAVVLNVWQTQVSDGASPLFSLPLKVALMWEGGTDTATVHVNNSAHTFYLAAPRAPYRVELDPEDDLLMELSFEQNQRELLGQLTEAGPAARRRAARQLGQAEAKRVAFALGTALQSDGGALVRQAAAASLGAMLTRTARDQLLPGLEDSQPAVREATVRALSRYRGNRQIAETLMDLFQTDSTYTVPATIVAAMGRLNVSQSQEFVVSAMEYGSHREVIRDSALTALGQIAEPGSIDLALQWAAYGKPPRVRRRAVAILPQLAMAAPDRRDELWQFLAALAHDRDFWVRKEVITALGKMGAGTDIELLEQALTSEPHHVHREAAWQALQSINSRRK